MSKFQLRAEHLAVGKKVRPIPHHEGSSNSYITEYGLSPNKWYTITRISPCNISVQGKSDCWVIEQFKLKCPGIPIINNGKENIEICGYGTPFEFFEGEDEWDY